MLRRRTTILRLEQIESRITPSQVFVYTDADGDDVHVTLSKNVLTDANTNAIFKFTDPDPMHDRQLYAIDLSSLDPAQANGLAITVNSTAIFIGFGDGFAAVGEIYAPGIDLGPVRIDGDLGKIVAGNATNPASGVKGLIVQSMGRFGTNTAKGIASGAADLNSVIQGKLDYLWVKADMKNASVSVQGATDGKIGPVLIGGSLIGGASADSGRISSSSDMGPVTIKGNLIGGGDGSGAVSSGGRLFGLKIGGSVRGGIGDNSARISSTGDMGLVTITGNLAGGSGNDSGEVHAGGLLAGLRIGGSVQGGSGNRSGRIFADGNAGAILIGGDLIGGSATGAANLSESGYIQAQRIAAITLGGSLIAGTDESTGVTFSNNGAIRVEDDLGSVLIKGSMVGNPTNTAIISARGKANLPLTATTDVAIGRLIVVGTVEDSLICAGVDPAGLAANADAQIGPVFVGGDWVASSIAAGAEPGADKMFGTPDDVKMTGAKDTGILSKITSLTIAGQAMGTFGGTDNGIVAENVAAVKIGGAPVFLLPDPSTDIGIPIGITGDFKINEVPVPVP